MHAAGVDVDALVLELLGTDEGRADPYSRYRAIRSSAPVYRSPQSGVWYLTRHQDCKDVLHDPRFGRGIGLGSDHFGGLGGTEASRRQELTSGARNMLFADPPDHTRLRGLVSRAFTPKHVEALRSKIVALVEPLLDEMSDTRTVDVMDALAFPLPVAVIGELVGVPPDDRPGFRSLVRDSTAMIEALPPPDALERAERAMTEMANYFGELVEKRRVEPADDLLSAMIAVEDGGDRLSVDELVATAILLFGAGFETTTNLIGNGLFALLHHPDQFGRLRSDPGLVPAAVEEMLRFDSPVQIDVRTALEPADVAGHPVEQGTPVVTFLGAANRDPELFAEPDRFDAGRADNHPLSFGWGIHHCLGAHLARAEGQVVFDRLLERFSSIELAGPEPRWRPSVTLRGLDHLHVEVMPR